MFISFLHNALSTSQKYYMIFDLLIESRFNLPFEGFWSNMYVVRDLLNLKSTNSHY